MEENMKISRRSLLATTGAAAAGSLLARKAGAQAGVDGSKSAALFVKEDDGLAPATVDRLPLEWHKGRVKLLQEYLQDQGYAGALLSDRWNIIYFTGLFHSTTERPFMVFLPADKMAAIWFHPGLDRDLVKSWWATETESYFDFQHAEGAFPNLGKVQQGERVNLYEWVLKGLKKRGYDGKRIATDRDQKGQALQIAGGVEIGGCGGELYRAFLLAPWTDHQKKVWTVSRDCCVMQKDLSREGIACSTVAYQIHQHQVKEGMQKYIYHRPAHGMGMEGHQPPYLALGDYTMLEPGMIFSVEPGLYDPENGFGVNFSDGFAVQAGPRRPPHQPPLPVGRRGGPQ